MILVIDILVPDYGINMSVINLTNEIIKQFLKHSELEFPHECCGFILGDFRNNESNGIEYLPASNTKEKNKERRFLIDPMAYKKAEDEANGVVPEKKKDGKKKKGNKKK